MFRNVTISAAVLCVASGVAGSAHAQSLTPLQQSISASVASDKSINVVPFEFDPNNTNLVRSTWLTGTACFPVFDPVCSDGDAKDKKVEGLLLVKTGPTSTVAAAGARINGVKGMLITELGYDIRKPGSSADPRGSHCGAGAPRFNVVIAGVTYFVGCSSPPPTLEMPSFGWVRLRWGGPMIPVMAFNSTTGMLENISTRPVDAVYIIFDEGQDTGPDNFGIAFLDNVDVNGQLAGRGPGSGN